MKKYKVIAGTCWSELTQSHLAHGAIVTTANFTDGEAQRKCNEGWLVEVVEEVKAEQPKETSSKKSK
jgi:hypothetical protein